MANSTANVSTAKPKTSGAIYRAAVGATAPSDATTALDAEFTLLGYVSEDGVTNDNSPESDSIKAWGGDTVLNFLTEKNDEFGFTLLEIMNLDVLKTVYGDDNVTGTLSTGITVNATSDAAVASAWVIEMILNGGVLKRIYIPNATITEIGTITYKADEAIGYELTLSAIYDEDGVSHKEFISSAS